MQRMTTFWRRPRLSLLRRLPVSHPPPRQLGRRPLSQALPPQWASLSRPCLGEGRASALNPKSIANRAEPRLGWENVLSGTHLLRRSNALLFGSRTYLQ